MKFIEDIKIRLQSINEGINYVYKYSKDSNTHFFYLYPESLRFSEAIDEVYYSGIDQILDENLNIDLCFTFEKDTFFSFDNPDSVYQSTQVQVKTHPTHPESELETSNEEMSVITDKRLGFYDSLNTWVVKDCNYPRSKSSRFEKVLEVEEKNSEILSMAA